MGPIYVGSLEHLDDLKPNPEEVAGLVWYTTKELEEEMAEHPERFIPNLPTLWQQYRDKLVP